MEQPIVLLIGYADRSGKDTFAEYLTEELDKLNISNYKDNFARPLKESYAVAHDISVDELDYLKNTDNGKTRNSIIKFAKKNVELFGNIYANYIFDIYTDKKDNLDVFIITDFRHLNEFKRFEGLNVVTLKIDRGDTLNHYELEDFEFDIVIDNDKDRTLEDLKNAAREIATVLQTIIINDYMHNNDKEGLKSRGWHLENL